MSKGTVTVKTTNQYHDRPVHGYDKIDDVKEQREIATIILEKLNYSIPSVQSGEKAVAYLNQKQVDLLVLDMIMDTGIDGLDTCRGVFKINPKQKAMIVSGFLESDRVKAAQSLGAGRYF